MNNKVIKLILCFVLLLTFTTSEKVYAYADLTDFNYYIQNLEISYKDLSLTDEELKAIEELRQNGGITYGMYTYDNTVLMVFNQIAKVFEIEVHPVAYEDFTKLIDDVARGKIDFSGSVYHSDERNQLFDYTTSTHRDKTFMYIKHEVYHQINSNEINTSRVLKIGYPEGFSIEGFLTDSFKDTYDYEMISLNSMEDGAKLLDSNELDIVLSDITWYERLILVPEVMAIDYTDYIDSIYAGSITKKGTNKEFLSAINKMYAETDALIELQNQIDNYYENAAIYALSNRYNNATVYDKPTKIYASEFRPFVYQENGVTTGLLMDFFYKLCNSFGLNYEINFVNNINLEDSQEDVMTIAMPLLNTNENREKYNLSIPVTESNMKIITIPDNTTKYFTRVSDLGVQKVGALDYSYMHDYTNEVFFNPENITYYDDLDSLVKAIEAQEIKFGIVSYEEFNKYALKNQITHLRVLSTIKLPQFGISFGTPKTIVGSNTEAVLSSAVSIVNYSELENKYLATNSEIEEVYRYRNENLKSLNHMIFFTSLFTVTALCSLIYINTRRANTDYLTKLRNRRTLEAYIETVKTRKNMSIAYIDLDNFKIINDVYGHHYGDKVLIYVASSLKKLSKYSRAFRIGGDEFIIVYNKQLIDFENDIKKVLGVNISIEQSEIKVEGSIGNLDLENHSSLEVEDIINLVDYAMISAKRRGKNLIVEIDDELVDNYMVIRDLRLALEKEDYKDTLKFYFQPIEGNSNLKGFTLLAKCFHDEKFFDYNELQIYMNNKQVLNKINLLVFEKLCIAINHINNNKETKLLFIHDMSMENITEQSIDALSTIMSKYDINPKVITLRVNPNLFVGNKGQRNVNLLNSLGCNITVDFYKMTGESLFYLNQSNITLIELELFGFIEFLKNYEQVEAKVLSNSLSRNLAIRKVVDLVEILATNLLLYTSNDMLEYLILEYFTNSVNTKVFTLEKDNLTLFEDYLQNIDMNL